MQKAKSIFGGALLLGSALILTPAKAAGELSQAQQAMIASQIKELKAPEERAVAAGWSDAKKVAEFICRPLALSELQKWNKQADRVFLGTDDPRTLDLTDNHLLSGSGDVRTGNDWTSFKFTCELDPQTGKARSFESDLSSR
ncbi:DUF930 domain-containing protein [Rhizobium sp. LC145]|uniref:DUF930 domain-containing protein n=1 Tax=Rhizobium sp. LC145 TaxID=1120688 RepID=UPI00062A1416|nr:DUF930 domain-containing protein [Rhizobium sp. LC145]KKX32971.1 hypothetical protein YH62_05325 [Rhizobium sp. LC145]TKT57382.1 DUF930 domain-containing protein [Rhizobiaceae bacterium LC148]